MHAQMWWTYLLGESNGMAHNLSDQLSWPIYVYIPYRQDLTLNALARSHLLSNTTKTLHVVF